MLQEVTFITYNWEAIVSMECNNKVITNNQKRGRDTANLDRRPLHTPLLAVDSDAQSPGES